MLSLNRYKLRHLANNNHSGARRAEHLLKRPDRLLSVILIGNNLVNVLATLIAGELTTRYFGEWVELYVLPIVLTIVFLIFAEVTPKTLAAYFPEKIAFPASLILKPLLVVLHPFVSTINMVANGLAHLLGVDAQKHSLTENLHPDELRTVVDEAGELIPDHHQGMLLNVLDLEKSSVEDIMVPRNEVIGIDLDEPIEDILELLYNTEYSRLPVFEKDINNVVGELHMRKLSRFLKSEEEFNHSTLRKYIDTPYFVPESTPLSTQLINFQKTKRRLAMVVDEYGEVQGIATLVDLLEEIVGDFVTDSAEEEEEEITQTQNNWYSIDASTSVRDINKQLGWDLPTDGPKTLNGIILEYLESIPDALVSFEIGDYRFEIEELADTRVEKARVFEKKHA